ncbi:MAG: hypothetical protein Q4B47_00370 [Eubacteriales bacterium]|nr:hypothetical protein [Eubacteriales bacterium]
MKNRKYFVLSLSVIAAVSIISGCGKKDDSQLVVSPTPEAVIPGPTEAPALQSTSFTSKDKSISIELPDTTWANKNDRAELVSFESAEQGKILIMHITEEKDLSSTLIPTTQDLAKAMAQSDGLTEGADFEIKDFTEDMAGDMKHYSYTVEYKDAAKAKGVYHAIYEYFVAEKEVYSIEGTVKSADANVLSGIQKSIASIKLNAVAKAAPAKAETTPTPEPETKSSIESLPAEVLSDTAKTRTIYRNEDGQGIPIMLDGSGNWVDENGNVYRFSETEESTVYDAQDTDYYYGGEGANVFYMSSTDSTDSEESDDDSYDDSYDSYDDSYDYDSDYYDSGDDYYESDDSYDEDDDY